MARAEIEDAAFAAMEAAPASKYFAAGEPTDKHQLIRFWNIETLAIHFGLRNLKVFRNSIHDWVPVRDDPQPFLFTRFTPLQIAGSAHTLFEYLGIVSRMKADEAHAVHDPSIYALDNLIAYFPMRGMSPPDQNIGLIQDFLGQPMLGLIQSRRPDIKACLIEAIGDNCMDSFWVDLCNRFDLFLMAKFVPDCDAD